MKDLKSAMNFELWSESNCWGREVVGSRLYEVRRGGRDFEPYRVEHDNSALTKYVS